MVKNTSLSSDLDLIKELEELRIKQKLLVEALSKKKISQTEEILVNLNGKLDFLVKIFQESNEEESDSDNPKITMNDLLDKLNSIEENFNSKFESLSVEIKNSSVETIKPSVLPSEKLVSLDKSVTASSNSSSVIEKSNSTPITQTSSPNTNSTIPTGSEELPPTPNFGTTDSVKESKIIETAPETNLNKKSEVISEEKSEEEKKKKKKWF